MSDEMNRRRFLGRAAHVAAAGTLLNNLDVWAADTSDTPTTTTSPATQPSLDWRNKQPTMTYAKLGRTHFMASRCVFGGGGLSGGSTQMLERAIECGVNYIDTGRNYKNSEATIAPIAKRYRGRIWVVSKAAHLGFPDLGFKRGEDAEAVKLYTGQLDESLRQLKVDTIDCYMLQGVEHEWVVTMDSLYEAFVKARKAGKVRYFGLATHTNVPKICELAAESKRYDVIMLTVNPNSLAGLAPSIRKMRDAGIGIVSMKATASIRAEPRVYDDKYEQMFEGKSLSPYQRAFAYMLHSGLIDAFNSHMPNMKILEENLAVPTLKLSQAALDRIGREAIAEARGACHHCGKCTRACPQGVNVADMLRYHAYVHTYREPDMARLLYNTQGRDLAPLCKKCGTCRSVCPESIDLPGIVSAVRAELA